MKNLFIVAVILLMWQIAAAGKMSANLNTAFQIDRVTFVLPAGRIVVYMPGDFSPGEQISGNIIVIPNGKHSLKPLLDGKLDFDGVSIPVKPGAFRLKLPESRDGFLTAVLKLKRENSLSVKIPFARRSGAAPEGLLLPTIGQTGRPLVIPGNFDGDFTTTTVQINQQSIPLISESPRQLSAYPPNGLLGPTDISVTENGATAAGEYRSVGISFSAPKMTLYKGEKAKVKMWVKGLKGIERPVIIEIDNLTPDIVKVTPIEAVIAPGKVSDSGTVMIPITLRRLKSGTFNLAAMVNALKWDCPDACEKDNADSEDEIVLAPVGADPETYPEKQAIIGPYPISDWPAKFLSDINDRYLQQMPKFTVWVRENCRRCEPASCSNGAKHLDWAPHPLAWIKVDDFDPNDTSANLKPILEDIRQKAQNAVTPSKCQY